VRFVRLDPAPVLVAVGACAAPDHDPESGVRRMDRYAALACTVAERVLVRAERVPDSAGDPRWGVVLGSSLGSWASNARYLDDLVERLPVELSPVLFARTVSNTINGEIAIARRLGGVSHTLVSGWSAGADAIAEAAALVAEGRADWMLAGGVEAPDPTLDALHAERRREPGLGWLPSRVETGAAMCLLGRPDRAAPRGSFALHAYHRAHDPRATWSLAEALAVLAPSPSCTVVVSNTVPPDLLARWRTEASRTRIDVAVDHAGELGAAGAPGAIARALDPGETSVPDELLIVSRAVEGATTVLGLRRNVGPSPC
jgi:Beta-ketoacyl synthase, N-terminal domain